MKTTLTFELISPLKCCVFSNVKSLHCNTVKGQMTIYPMHASILAKLDMGIIRVVCDNEVRFLNYEGILEFENDKGKIIVESFLFKEDIDLDRFRQLQENVKNYGKQKGLTIKDNKRHAHEVLKLRYMSRMLE